MTMNVKLATSLFTVLLFSAPPASAQIRASEDARVEQTVDGTKMSMQYSRPRGRGRDTIFGGQVHWNEVWTPGANWATKFRTSKPVRINGQELPAGYYSVWFQVRQNGPWTVMFDSDTTRSHVQRPVADAVPVKFDVTPQPGSHTESLTWSFSDYDHLGTTLLFAWDTVRIPLEIKVTPSQRLNATAAEAARATGTFDMQWSMERNKPPQPGSLVVTYSAADSTLRAKADIPGDDDWDLVLAPKADGVFVAIFTNKGEIWSTAESYLFEFAVEGDKAGTVELRLASNDRLLGSGTRKP